jgi:hypothetical protein
MTQAAPAIFKIPTKSPQPARRKTAQAGSNHPKPARPAPGRAAGSETRAAAATINPARQPSVTAAEMPTDREAE